MTHRFFLFVLLLFALGFLAVSCNPRIADGVRKKDLRKDVLLQTSMGDIRLRLFNETPLHRNNFIRLVKEGYYDSIQFHRVIDNFMIQAGDPNSRRATDTTQLGEGDKPYTIPAEFVPSLYHRKGVLAAARMGDDVNPKKESSGSQFYIVEGKKFTDAGLDSVEVFRLKGRKIPADQRAVYKTEGGAPHLDQNYTIFGEVISGMSVVEAIAAVPTSGREGGDRPLQPVRIVKARLVKQ
ncbi:peptidylprolyl isomerase [Flavihumibacter petaseus]|uniref:peptidylprolyl isomerase n=1 Tax=Flavihumibacter petaseus NBRC 106054 TaxID=1220578 RepID=A0A0E9MW29_9BACT|nr:peptidylprolyl isomerase [Flavihumibacter petaseus]GAO41799.1 putative peptidyl-prolyl cis-trans isomerase [Flavihumibacter petaseus NBRC 106054]